MHVPERDNNFYFFPFKFFFEIELFVPEDTQSIGSKRQVEPGAARSLALGLQVNLVSLGNILSSL